MSEELKPCKQLNQVPEVVTPWQLPQCPACKHYHHPGKCDNAKRVRPDDPCPYDNKALPLRVVDEDDMEEARHASI